MITRKVCRRRATSLGAASAAGVVAAAAPQQREKQRAREESEAGMREGPTKRMRTKREPPHLLECISDIA